MKKTTHTHTQTLLFGCKMLTGGLFVTFHVTHQRHRSPPGQIDTFMCVYIGIHI